MSVSDPSLYLLILLSGAFLGAFVQGATGFGSGLLINAFWLHIMEPTHAIPLNVVTSLFISGVLPTKDVVSATSSTTSAMVVTWVQTDSLLQGWVAAGMK